MIDSLKEIKFYIKIMIVKNYVVTLLPKSIYPDYDTVKN